MSAALGYAMQIPCADPEAHRLSRHPNRWASDDGGQEIFPGDKLWNWRHPVATEAVEVRPAIIHLPKCRELLAGSAQL